MKGRFKCRSCQEFKTIEHFWSRDLEKKRGELHVKKGRDASKIMCHACGNPSNASKVVKHDLDEKEDEIWGQMDDTFEEHCKMLGEGLHEPWTGSGDSLGRSFTDRKRVTWNEIINRSEYYRDQMIMNNPNRYRAIKMDKRYEGNVRWGLAPPITEHAFYSTPMGRFEK